MSDQVRYRSADGTVLVKERGGRRPVRSLTVDGVVAGDDSPLGLVMQSRLGLLPALMKPRVRQVLAVGVGTGITLGALAAALGSAHITAVERCPDVLEAAGLFRDHWARPIDRPPVTLVAAEGREHLGGMNRRCGLIACDLLSPAGEGRTFTRAFYRLCAGRLTANGLFTQWLPLFQIPLPALRRAVSAFVEVFPSAALWLAGFNTFKPVALLVGGTGPCATGGLPARASCNTAHWRTSRQWHRALAAVPSAGLPTGERVHGLHVLDGKGLRTFIGEAPPFEDGEILVEAREAREGLEDGGRQNVGALIDCGEEINETQRTFFEASCAHERGDWTVALEGYRRVFEVWPDDPLVRLAAGQASCSVLIGRALDLWAMDGNERAESLLRQAIDTEPDRADAHEYLAKLLTSVGRHEEALVEIELALVLDLDDADLKTGRDAILYNLTRRTGKGGQASPRGTQTPDLTPDP